MAGRVGPRATPLLLLFPLAYESMGPCCQLLAPAGHCPTGVFALAVIRRRSDGRFLLTQEFGREGFWLPGGGVNRGESLQQGGWPPLRPVPLPPPSLQERQLAR